MKPPKITKKQAEALGNFAADMEKRLDSMNSNTSIRTALIARITRAANNPRLSVVALHQIAQALETFE